MPEIVKKNVFSPEELWVLWPATENHLKGQFPDPGERFHSARENLFGV